MKHGKEHRRVVEQSLPEWREEFLAYKKLKQQVKLIHSQLMETMKNDERARLSANDGLDAAGMNMVKEDIDFMQLLEDELNKINSFFMDKEELYIIILKELKDKVGSLECNQDLVEVERDILELHKEMVQLLHYCVTNLTGLKKIVKKHDKKTGASIYSSFMPKVMQQPFFSTDLLYKLMTECEAMLYSLIELAHDP